MPTQLAKWNHARGVWETQRTNMLCGHSEPYSETWPGSGMTRSGEAFELPMLAHHMDGSGYSSLPTPRDTRGGSATETMELLGTPTTNIQPRSADFRDGRTPNLAEALLPTPSVADGTGGHARRSGERSDELLLPGAALSLLPTPEARLAGAGPDYARADRDGSGGDDLGTAVHRMLSSEQPDASSPPSVTDWGPYTAAVRRWEALLGRDAPAPTEVGPKGGQRLAPRLVEWMMGLPDGHVTAVPGLSRNDQMKALGNGVVPQQAAAALALLLEDLPGLTYGDQRRVQHG